ncbi:hypothetical protein RMATCC62417_07052 [Rhizopus microsporus]|nr:hypothetical protein RMATCC62417_07052 [Rhizopus microsporus]
MSNSQDESLISAIKTLHDRYSFILEKCQQWNKQSPILGLYRYTNSLLAEKHFIEKLLQEPTLIKKEHVQSTNLGYLEPVYEALESIECKNEVMKIIGVPLPNQDIWLSQVALIKRKSIKVDIIAQNGLVWVKVIARNAKAFRHEVMGLEQKEEDDDYCSDDDDDNIKEPSASDFDSLPIFNKARDYLMAARAYHVHYHTPVVVFAFMRIRPQEDVFVQRIMDRLTEMGIIVHLQTPDNDLQGAYMPLLKGIDVTNLSTEKLNLDVSSIFALISELSHHPCSPDDISAIPIKVQAEREASVRCLPQLKRIVEGKELYMVQTAYDRLKSIIDIVGGPNEIARFQYLFRHSLGHPETPFDQDLWSMLPSLEVHVIQDAPSTDFFQLLEPPPQKSKLNNGRKIRTRFSEFHAIVFGSGHYYQMTTLTAIQWMEKALTDAGVLGTFIICHEPRSLAEQKMVKK